MAWVLSPNLHRPVVAELSATSRARFEELNKELRESHAGYPREHELYKPRLGPSAGLRYPPVCERFEGKINSFQAPLLGMFSTPAGQTISETTKQIIEEIEPGVHQYFPIDLTLPDGSKTDESFYIINICNRFDSICPDNSESIGVRRPYKDEFPEYFRYSFKLGRSQGVSIKRSVVGGAAIWFDWRVDLKFISNDFLERALAANVLRLEEYPFFLHKTCEV